MRGKGALMRRLLLPWVVAGGLVAGACADTNRVELVVTTDRPGAVYQPGEEARFLVSVKSGGKPVTDGEVSFTMGQEGMPDPHQGKVRLAQGAGSFGGTLKQPGFLQCRVAYRAMSLSTNVVTALAAAGFAPEDIRPSLPVPADFDAFWTAQKKRLAAVPMKPELTPVKSPMDGVECFDVKIPCVPPRPVSGYFAKPADARAKGHPAMLSVHGAGVHNSNLAGAAGMAKLFNALAMDINAHGIPNGNPKAFYEELSRGELKEYRRQGCEDREKCYFLGMFLRLVRALEFLKSQPEWDGRVLIVRGSSQGGGQSIAAAGLDAQVSFISAGVPAICDHSGKAAGRVAGWPKLVPEVDGKPDPTVLEVARYFDCMNFATRAKAEGLFDVGFIDITCPPSSVYAMYNNWPGKKEMHIEPLMGHAVSPRFVDATNKRIKAHIQKFSGNSQP